MITPTTFMQRSRNSALAFWVGRHSVALLIAFLILAIAGFLKWQSQQMPGNTDVPMLHAPSPNARDFYTEAERRMQDDMAISWALSNQPLDPRAVSASLVADWNKGYHHFTLRDKQNLVRKNALALATLRAGMRYAYLGPQSRSFASPIPTHGKDRQMGRLLLLEGGNKAATGDWSGAETSYLDALKFGSDLPHGSGLLGALVGIAVQASARRHLWNTTAHLNTGQAETAVQRLLQIDAAHAVAAEVFRNEQWHMQGALLEEFRKPQWRRDFSISQFDEHQAAMCFAFRLESPRTVYDNYTHYLDRVIAQSRLPWPELRQAKPPAVPKDPANQELSPIFTGISLRVLANTTFNRLLETEIALHAYRLEHGTYPGALDALTPRYLPSVPADPFSDNQPLCYRGTGMGYLLYSIGPDMKDDGGRPMISTDRWGKTHHYINNPGTPGDIVPGVNY